MALEMISRARFRAEGAGRRGLARWFVLALVLGAWRTFGSSASAQLSPEEAYQRLLERQKQRQASQQPAPTTEPGRAAPGPTSRPSAMQVGRMLHQAWDDLMAHRYAKAISQFDKVIADEPRDTVSLEGRGICKYELRQYKLAERDLELAYRPPAKGATGAGAGSRQLAIAVAAAETMNANPMRAVKVLRGLMEPMEQDGKLDEELQNDLGIALSHASDQARKQEYFVESLKYYMAYDKRLNEQKRDGAARWGTQWVSKSAADEKWKTYLTATAGTEQAASNYDHALLAEEHAKDHYIELHGMRLHGTLEIKKFMDEYKQAILDTRAAKAHLNESIDHLNRTDKPPFPERIEHAWQEPR